MKGIVLTALFFILTPIALATSLFSLSVLTKNTPQPVPQQRIAGARVYASLPETSPSISGEVTAADARPQIIKAYLSEYNSPLEPYAETIVEEADKYNLDYRLITAIAQQESNLCKIIPPGGFNCWGWGIHSAGTLGFQSFDEGIATVTRGLRENYLDKGYNTVEEIMSKYTPLSQGSWAYGVNLFLTEIEL